MKVIVKKCDTISRKIDATGAKNQVGIENIRAKLKLFNALLMSALIYRMEAWGNIRSVKMREIEKMHETAPKKDISTSIFNSLYCYHNGNRNMASRAKDTIC